MKGFKQKFIDGTEPTPEYLRALADLVEDACEAMERVGLDELEARALEVRTNSLEDRPLASHGLTSYRYKGVFGWIMIGAKDTADALREAQRSLSFTREAASVDKLQVWNGTSYVEVRR